MTKVGERHLLPHTNIKLILAWGLLSNLLPKLKKAVLKVSIFGMIYCRK